MRIFFRPFQTGDFVEAAGFTGVVEQIRIFNTLPRTPDNREIIVPNAVRPWVKSEDYRGARADLLEDVKAAFDANGVSIPFPQRDVHLHEVSKTAA